MIPALSALSIRDPSQEEDTGVDGKKGEKRKQAAAPTPGGAGPSGTNPGAGPVPRLDPANPFMPVVVDPVLLPPGGFVRNVMYAPAFPVEPRPPTAPDDSEDDAPLANRLVAKKRAPATPAPPTPAPPVPPPPTPPPPPPPPPPTPVVEDVVDKTLTYQVSDGRFVGGTYTGPVTDGLPDSPSDEKPGTFTVGGADLEGFATKIPTFSVEVEMFMTGVGIDEQVWRGVFFKGDFVSGSVTIRTKTASGATDTSAFVLKVRGDFDSLNAGFKVVRAVTLVRLNATATTRPYVYTIIKSRPGGELFLNGAGRLSSSAARVVTKIGSNDIADPNNKHLSTADTSISKGLPNGAFEVDLNSTEFETLDASMLYAEHLSTISRATGLATPFVERMLLSTSGKVRIKFDGYVYAKPVDTPPGGSPKPDEVLADGHGRVVVESPGYEYERYTGGFFNGIRHGEKSLQEFGSGWSFYGTFANDARSGWGTLTTPDGNTWSGKWSDGLRTDDIGVFTTSDGDTALRGVWSQGNPFLSTAVLARKEAQTLNAKWKSDAVAAGKPWTEADHAQILVQKPGYDVPTSVPGDVVLRRAGPDTTAAVHKLFRTTNPTQLGVGMDTNTYLGGVRRYHKLVPVAVFDVDYSKSEVNREWQRTQKAYYGRMAYCLSGKNSLPPAQRRADGKTAEGFKPPPDPTQPGQEDNPLFVRTRLDRLPGLGDEGTRLDKKINETFLVHGTRSANVPSMLKHGPTNEYARVGRFGAAVYFAEDPGKSDQYCKLDTSLPRGEGDVTDEDYGTDGWLKKMLGIAPDTYETIAATSRRGRQDVFYMFIVRVALGCPALVTAKEYDLNRAGKPETLGYKNALMFDQPMYEARTGDTIAKMGVAKNLDNRFQSVVVDGWDTTTGGYANLRYREFMVYSGVVAKITHLVAYVRQEAWPTWVPNPLKWKPAYKWQNDPVFEYTDPMHHSGRTPVLVPAAREVVDAAGFLAAFDDDGKTSRGLIEIKTTPPPSVPLAAPGAPAASTAPGAPGGLVLLSIYNNQAALYARSAEDALRLSGLGPNWRMKYTHGSNKKIGGGTLVTVKAVFESLGTPPLADESPVLISYTVANLSPVGLRDALPMWGFRRERVLYTTLSLFWPATKPIGLSKHVIHLMHAIVKVPGYSWQTVFQLNPANDPRTKKGAKLLQDQWGPAGRACDLVAFDFYGIEHQKEDAEALLRVSMPTSFAGWPAKVNEKRKLFHQAFGWILDEFERRGLKLSSETTEEELAAVVP